MDATTATPAADRALYASAVPARMADFARRAEQRKVAAMRAIEAGADNPIPVTSPPLLTWPQVKHAAGDDMVSLLRAACMLPEGDNLAVGEWGSTDTATVTRRVAAAMLSVALDEGALPFTAAPGRSLILSTGKPLDGGPAPWWHGVGIATA
ncbi:hypothetical protein [Actinacidiphila sp. bgisy160]|uniref:hypothetical protein n=1 Tax=Actinacidiphila sp. bgisy160 TaxID=3413796 RepID=UPI003D7455D8